MTQTKEKEAGALDEGQSKLMQGKGFSFSGYERDSLRWHQGNGELIDISGVSGVDSISDGRGAVFADFDNDGDLDIFLTTIQGDAHLLFRNNCRSGGFLRVALQGTKSGRDAFGAVVRVKTSQGVETKIKAGGMGFLSQHDPRLLFGLGKDKEAAFVEVTWPNGTKTRVARVLAGSSLLFHEGEKKPTRIEEQKGSLPDPATAAERFLAGLRLQKGKALPEMKLATKDGKPARLPAQRTLINIWATWCTACAREMPFLEKLAPALEKRGIALLGLDIDEPADPARIARFLKKHAVTYPILLGGKSAIEALYKGDEVSAPISILVDSKGRIEAIHGGFGTDARVWLERLAGKDE